MLHNARLEAEISPVVTENSDEYIGRWNRLVSTTNWEKGRIIIEWRETLSRAGALPADYTDETWAQLAGGVSPQHVGRLRRVYERFGGVYQQYAGLYWSHFYSALDWPDAEMWLEGAVQEGWSISAMRRKRRETLGASFERDASESEAVAETKGEGGGVQDKSDSMPDAISEQTAVVRNLEAKAASPSQGATRGDGYSNAPDEGAFEAATVAPFRPFENLPSMPADLTEAFELFKLAILNHKLAGWQEIALDDVLAILDSLKNLALAPAE
jgi:hypothetical protein